ncbi:hypothetical protein PVL29_003121 [Vitis rotundifolia]|uniref:TF-B3 domain-containing protein n=1 Tax=Vitis rotundifolia TaxID=103349 RepID=A0AA39AC54_VITRO|nr:hypothetical protein PVL29_003121 [Vitis rotundifolia]
MQRHCRGQRPYHFFKIVLPSNASDTKLKIPPKFVNIFRDELTASATLTTPMGQVWPVRLEKASDNSCWICDGWKEFAEHHSIGCGYFLVFGYEGVSNFRVSVFDLTACEIRYPCNPSNGSQNPYHGKRSSVHPEEEMQDDGSVEILGSSPPWQPLTSLREGIFDVCVGQQIHRRGSKPLGSKKHKKSKHGCFRGSKKYKIEDHVESTRVDHLNPSSSRIFNSHGSSSLGKAKAKYRNHNQTDREDSLIKDRKGAKTNARTLSPKRCGRTEIMERIIHAARMFKPANPSFTIIMKPYKNRLLYVPTEFGRKHLKRKSIKLEDSTGRQWPLSCLLNRGGNIRLSKGWNEFVEEKNLKEGDVCVFELVQREDVVLKVSIFQW